MKPIPILGIPLLQGRVERRAYILASGENRQEGEDARSERTQSFQHGLLTPPASRIFYVAVASYGMSEH